MFNNIGCKIKGLAKFICWVGIIISVLSGIAVILGGASGRSYGSDYYGERFASHSAGGAIIVGILIIVIGSILSWVSSFVLYGFGELVDNSRKVADRVSPKE